MNKLLKVVLSFFVVNSEAQTETLSSGSFIINIVTTNPNTIANGLKPYGLVYDLMRNHKVPVKWVIGQGKLKDRKAIQILF